MNKYVSRLLVTLALTVFTGCASGPLLVGLHNKPVLEEDISPEGETLVLVSTRSQRQKSNNLYFYFLKEGATEGDKSRMIIVYRAAGIPIAGSNTTDREYQLIKAEPGKYRLYAHTVGYFEDVRPYAVKENGGYEYEWSGKTYQNESISFEVKEGEITYIGDIWYELAIRPDPGVNQRELRKHPKYKIMTTKIGEPRLEEAMDWLNEKYPSIKFPINHNTIVASERYRSQVECNPEETELFLKWTCEDYDLDGPNWPPLPSR